MSTDTKKTSTLKAKSYWHDFCIKSDFVYQMIDCNIQEGTVMRLSKVSSH